MATVTDRLPDRRSELVGREDELESLTALLGERSLITLVGTGGVGKSSLALEVARRAADLGRDVHLVDLVTVDDESLVASTIADGVGLAATSDLAPVDALVASLSLADDPLLLLDNCEHVADAVADLVDGLLAGVSEVVVLATSRERLDIPGEAVVPVEPLGTSGGDAASPAVALLLDRAADAGWRPTGRDADERVAELARRLDGIPLALELAAARLSSMSIAELLDQLDGQLSVLSRRRGAERHRSLDAVVAWSFELLEPPHQELLSALSVFSSGFDRAAAVEVAGAGAPAGLGELVSRSLLEATELEDGTRYRMLEMIRSFAHGRLEPARQLELERRHAAWAARWALDCQERMRGPDEPTLVPVFQRELPNIGVALRWATEHDERGLVADLASSLGDHLFFRPSREVIEWTEHALQTVPDAFDIEDLVMLGVLTAQRQGDLDTAERLLDELDSRGRTADRFILNAPLVRGIVDVFRGRIEEGHARILEATEAQEDPLQKFVWVGFASLPYAYAGRYQEALDLLDSVADLGDEIRWPTALGADTYSRAEALVGLDRPAALRAYRRADELANQARCHFFATINLVSWASALARYGDPTEALSRFGDAIDQLGAIGAWSYLSTTLRNFTELLVRIERYEDAVVIRSGVENLAGSTAVAGVDAMRDEYLKALLQDRILPNRYDQLVAEGCDLTREQVVQRAERVIDTELAGRRTGPALRAVVFTDLEGATAFMAREGDREARAVMRRYEDLTESLLVANRGSRVKGTGDGMLMTFASVSDALTCVQGLLAAIDERPDELPLRVRVGVHAGEMIDETETDEGDDIHGTVVNLAARVVDQADGGEVVVTDTARQIVVGAPFAFTPLGPVELKGIPQPVTLHRLERR